ncbi:alpha/beta hydrolase [Aminobacter anthyllidis]|uniref:Alpha/beta hydrolase n=1 Tax=Aminobacter anthyllidis TaxID=1035067 RepID=A0A9X1A9F2_9HYPH|nr:alpha/beta hydrolase [Aminobacter anthyllidis]MBT1155563.1 alpha/beta hydrolase [Aminobacter anthyllidis]
MLAAAKIETVPVHEERMVRTNGVELRAQAFGNPSDPALLLITGATASMKRWPEEFCTRLADAGRFVIRFDNRDTGPSTTFPPGAPGYTVRDMADDAVGVLDAYGIDRAHIAGWSMGGMITQNVAIHHPKRIRSAFLFGTTPDGSSIGSAASGSGKDSGAFAAPSPRIVQLLTYNAGVDWTDEAQAVEAWVHEDMVLTGPGDTFAADLSRDNAHVLVREARNILSHRTNHGIAVAMSYWRDRLKDIRVPTLIMHGTHDYILPLDHAKAMAAEIPGAKLVVVEGMGHVLSLDSRYWDVFARALIAHTAH